MRLSMMSFSLAKNSIVTLFHPRPHYDVIVNQSALSFLLSSRFQAAVTQAKLHIFEFNFY